MEIEWAGRGIHWKEEGYGRRAPGNKPKQRRAPCLIPFLFFLSLSFLIFFNSLIIIPFISLIINQIPFLYLLNQLQSNLIFHLFFNLTTVLILLFHSPFAAHIPSFFVVVVFSLNQFIVSGLRAQRANLKKRQQLNSLIPFINLYYSFIYSFIH